MKQETETKDRSQKQKDEEHGRLVFYILNHVTDFTSAENR